jgi:integrase/recombinase XerD
MLKERGTAAGLQPFTPHDLRRTFISNMLNLTDLATVSRLAGHEDTKTTASYDRRPIEHVIEAAALMNIPFTPRDDGLYGLGGKEKSA